MAKVRIRKEDKVYVISGKDRSRNLLGANWEKTRLAHRPPRASIAGMRPQGLETERPVARNPTRLLARMARQRTQELEHEAHLYTAYNFIPNPDRYR